MSKFMDFYSHVTESEATTKKLTDLMAKFDADSDSDAIFEELIVFAREEGYDFEKAELKAFLDGMTTVGELSDDELAVVAGGKGACVLVGASNDGAACFVVGYYGDGKGKGCCIMVGAFPE